MSASAILDMPLPGEAEPIPAEPPTLNSQQPTRIAENAVLLSITLCLAGNTRKVNQSQYEVDADKNMLSMSKRLLESPEYDAIKSLDSELKKFLAARCLPSMFRSGVHLLPVVLYTETEEKLRDFRIRRRQLVADFIASYDQRRTAAAERLKSLYNEDDYPPPDKLRSLFSMDWQYFTLDTPKALKRFDSALFNQEREKLKEKFRQMSEEAELLMRQEMRELVGHLADRLTAGEEGEKKILRSSAVTKIKEFLELAEARNVTGDEELNRLFSETRAIISNVDPLVLRDSEVLRAEIRSDMERIKAELDTQIQAAGSRKITLDESEW